MKQNYIEISGRRIGLGYPAYIVAEISANHNQKIDTALELIHMAKESGADAVKIQTYTPDTMTIESGESYFRIRGGIWDGQTLYNLYQDAYTPWEWHPRLKEVAEELGIHLFSTPYDVTAVDFLEDLGVPAYKIASFEVVDIPLIQHIARKGRPIIMSTGMATLAEIDEAVGAIRSAGNDQMVVLHCVSSYPAPLEEMNLRTIPHLAEAFGVPTGLSDHSLGIAAAVGAVALGACLIEKHVTLSRADGGPDSAFSLEPQELKQLVGNVREVEKALGTVHYELTEGERRTVEHRRSLFFVEDIKTGEDLTEKNVRVIRPGHGLAPKYYDQVIGRHAAKDVKRGTPVDWSLVAG